jgi:hypothetical protein
MTPTQELKGLLEMSGLSALRQDSRILLFSRNPPPVQRGKALSLEAGIDADKYTLVIKMVRNYLGFIRRSGPITLIEWAKTRQLPAHRVDFQVVENRVSSDSPYYVAGFSSVSRINLLKAARDLRLRVEASRSLRDVSDSAVRRHLKIKKIAAIYREGSEKVV